MMGTLTNNVGFPKIGSYPYSEKSGVKDIFARSYDKTKKQFLCSLCFNFSLMIFFDVEANRIILSLSIKSISLKSIDSSCDRIKESNSFVSLSVAVFVIRALRKFFI